MKAFAIALLLALAQAPDPVVTGKAYRFEKVVEGVYYATATGSMVTGSNNVVIIGGRDVLVVDTGTSPAAARAFLEDLKVITNKPVRYVVNALKRLDFQTVLPGHGVPFKDKALIGSFQGCLRDLQKQVTAFRKQGLSAEETAAKVDLTLQGQPPADPGSGRRHPRCSADVRMAGRKGEEVGGLWEER